MYGLYEKTEDGNCLIDTFKNKEECEIERMYLQPEFDNMLVLKSILTKVTKEVYYGKNII